MNSKQRRQFTRKKLREFPKGCLVNVDGGDRVYFVVHHWAGSFDASALVFVRAVDDASTTRSVNFNRLIVARPKP